MDVFLHLDHRLQILITTGQLWSGNLTYYIYIYISTYLCSIYICIGCSLTSVTVGKLIFYENLFKRSTRNFMHFSICFSCKNCALNRAVLVLPSVQKSCSTSCCFGAPLRAKIVLYIVLFWCSPPCKNRALNRAVLVLPSVQKSCSRSCCLVLSSVQKSCSKSCCFGAPLRAKIVL